MCSPQPQAVFLDFLVSGSSSSLHLSHTARAVPLLLLSWINVLSPNYLINSIPEYNFISPCSSFKYYQYNNIPVFWDFQTTDSPPLSNHQFPSILILVQLRAHSPIFKSFPYKFLSPSSPCFHHICLEKSQT